MVQGQKRFLTPPVAMRFPPGWCLHLWQVYFLIMQDSSVFGYEPMLPGTPPRPFHPVVRTGGQTACGCRSGNNAAHCGEEDHTPPQTEPIRVTSSTRCGHWSGAPPLVSVSPRMKRNLAPPFRPPRASSSRSPPSFSGCSTPTETGISLIYERWCFCSPHTSTRTRSSG